MAEMKLGLCNPPLPIYLYVDKLSDEGGVYGWYNYDFHQDKKVPVIPRALTGYLSELRLTDKDFKGKDNLKLDIVVLADEVYIVRSGIETNFTKSFLLAASIIEDFSKPLMIVVNPGDENVIFCNLYDAETKAKIRHDWNPNTDWAEIIQDIQTKLSCDGTRSYGLEEDFGTTVKQSIAKPKIPPNPQDLRIRQIRTLLGYPVDLVKEYLRFQDVELPSQLDVRKVNELVKTMCLAWAADKVEHPNHAESSYQRQVLQAIADSVDEVKAIRVWMNYVVGQRIAVDSNINHSKVE
jgi:hypothetical protein